MYVQGYNTQNADDRNNTEREGNHQQFNKTQSQAGQQWNSGYIHSIQ